MTCFWGKGATQAWDKQQRPVHKSQDTTVCDGLSALRSSAPPAQSGTAFIGSTRRAFSAAGQRKAVFIHPFKRKHTLSHTHTHMHTHRLPPLCPSLTLTPLYPFNFRLSLKPAVCWHIQVCWCCYWHVRVVCVWVRAPCELVLRLRHAGFTES